MGFPPQRFPLPGGRTIIPAKFFQSCFGPWVDRDRLAVTTNRSSMAARLAVKSVSDSLSVVVPSPRRTEGASLAGIAAPAAVALASSPTADSMVSRMRAVLKRHQCGSEEEAVTVCMRQAAQAAAKPSVSAAGPGPCNGYINSLRYCQLQTQQHNYPVAPAFLY